MIPIRDDNPTSSVPLVTWLIIVANIGVFFYELSLPPGQLEAWIGRWALVPARVGLGAASLPVLARGLLVPFFSSLFLHGGWLHLIGNMWSLWLFGDNIEDRIGHTRFLLFYLTVGFFAGALHVAIQPGSNVPTLGASGAVAGVMGAYFLLFPTAWVTVLIPLCILPIFIRLPAALYLLIWIGFQLVGGYNTLTTAAAQVGGIAFWAHVGGFGAGMLLIRRFAVRRRRPRQRLDSEQQ